MFQGFGRWSMASAVMLINDLRALGVVLYR